MRFLFVVHRTYPYNGGSEYNVKLITEELVKQTHDVTVLTDCGGGDYNGVKVTTARNVLFEPVDLVVVHGADMPIQDYALENLDKVPSKLMYWMIKPSNSIIAKKAFNGATYIGWGTSTDLIFLKKYNAVKKGVYIRFAMDNCSGTPIPKKRRIFLSGGGFSHHKKFVELAEVFDSCDFYDTILLLTGYVMDPPEIFSQGFFSKNVVVKKIASRQEYLDILSSSDLYIMNSVEEGFGLVLLEAMRNRIPWISTDIAGAHDMRQYGTVYKNTGELQTLMRGFKKDSHAIELAYNYVVSERNPKNMVTDLLSVFSR